jgi:hypothetical protein
MRHVTRFVGIPLALFAVFIIAGSIGLTCESLFNNLAMSTTAFLGAFTGILTLAWHFYYSIW